MSRSPHTLSSGENESPDIGFLEQIQLYSDYVANQTAGNIQSPVQPGERPKQFIVWSGGMIGLQASLSQLQTEVQTLAKLGVNTVMAVRLDSASEAPIDHDWPGIDISEVQTVLDNAGLAWRGAAGTQPLLVADWPVGIPTYFDFYLQNHPIQFNKYVTACTNLLTSSYSGSLEKLVVLALADEPNWSYSNLFAYLNSIPLPPPGQLTVFQQYLSNLPQGFSPSQFVAGATSWSDPGIIPSGRPTNGTNPTTQISPQNRLFFWTIRFFAESASNGMSMVRNALNNAFDLANNGIHVQTDMFVDWNNFTTQFGWYEVTPTSPAPAYGYFDWLDWGRKNAGTLWTEDLGLYQDAQSWSFFGDGLRSAGMLASNYGNSPPQPGEPGVRPLADVYPFHIIGGHLSLYPSGHGIYIGSVLAAEITDNQIQAAVSLEFNESSGNSSLYLADLAETITGYNPITQNPNETVSNITHLLLYNTGNPIAIPDNTVLAMTIIYAP